MLYNQNWEQPKSNPVSDLLLTAAGLLETWGHTKGIREDDLGRMCALGAINKAQGQDAHWVYNDSLLTGKAAKALVDVMGLEVPLRCQAWANQNHLHERHAVAEWNNKPERTAQEVIDAMRKTAEVVAKVSVEA